MQPRLKRAFWLSLPALIAVLAYLPAAGFDFVWDDTIFLHDLPLYRDSGQWREALGQAFALSPNYFRPLGVLTFMAELRVAGLDPSVFHLTNVLLHGLNTLLVTILAFLYVNGGREVRDDGWVIGCSVLGGLLYGLHPALVEGVAFVSSRFDLLLTTFLVAVLVIDLGVRHRPLRPVCMAIAFLLAALAKEMAVALAVVLPCWYLARAGRPLLPLRGFWGGVRPGAGRAVSDVGGSDPKRGGRRRRGTEAPGAAGTAVSVYGALLVAGAVYLAIRHGVLGYLLRPEIVEPIPSGAPVQHLLLVAKSLASYAVLVTWPFSTLTPIHFSELPVPTGDPWAWGSLALVAVLVVSLLMLVQLAPRVGWLAIGGSLSLLPVSNIAPLTLGGGAIVAERFLLFPMVLFTVASAAAVLRFVEPAAEAKRSMIVRRAVAGTLIAGWLAGSLVTVERTLPHWAGDVSLWTWTAERSPRSPMSHTNLALQHVNRGNYAAGLVAAAHAIELDPEESNAFDNAGLALFHMGRYAEAQDAFQRAVELEPDNALYWSNLAGALRERGQLQAAERVLLDEALRRNPTLPSAHLNLGVVYLRADRPDLARSHLLEAERLLPPDRASEARELLPQTMEPGRWLRLGDLLLANGDPAGAVRAFAEARTLGARGSEAAAGESSALMHLGSWAGAEAVLREALAAFPDDPRIHNNLGVVARERGDLEAAHQWFSSSARLAPDWELPRQNLTDLLLRQAEMENRDRELVDDTSH